MIGTIYSNQGPKPLLKLFNRTRYDTAGLTASLASFLTRFSIKTASGFSMEDWPFYFVLDQWNGSATSGPVQSSRLAPSVQLIRLLRPEKADKLKSVVDRVADLDTHLANPDVTLGFFRSVGYRIGFPVDTTQEFHSTIAVLPKTQDPDMSEIKALLLKDFLSNVDGPVHRANQAINTVRHRLKSKGSYSKHVGFDVEDEIRKSAPPDVQVWLEKIDDDRRHPTRTPGYDAPGDEEIERRVPEKLVFRAKVS